jgi:hypothetical protein
VEGVYMDEEVECIPGVTTGLSGKDMSHPVSVITRKIEIRIVNVKARYLIQAGPFDSQPTSSFTFILRCN